MISNQRPWLTALIGALLMVSAAAVIANALRYQPRRTSPTQLQPDSARAKARASGPAISVSSPLTTPSLDTSDWKLSRYLPSVSFGYPPDWEAEGGGIEEGSIVHVGPRRQRGSALATAFTVFQPGLLACDEKREICRTILAEDDFRNQIARMTKSNGVSRVGQVAVGNRTGTKFRGVVSGSTRTDVVVLAGDHVYIISDIRPNQDDDLFERFLGTFDFAP